MNKTNVPCPSNECQAYPPTLEQMLGELENVQMDTGYLAMQIIEKLSGIKGNDIPFPEPVNVSGRLGLLAELVTRQQELRCWLNEINERL